MNQPAWIARDPEEKGGMYGIWLTIEKPASLDSTDGIYLGANLWAHAYLFERHFGYALVPGECRKVTLTITECPNEKNKV